MTFERKTWALLSVLHVLQTNQCIIVVSLCRYTCMYLGQGTLGMIERLGGFLHICEQSTEGMTSFISLCFKTGCSLVLWGVFFL